MTFAGVLSSLMGIMGNHNHEIIVNPKDQKISEKEVTKFIVRKVDFTETQRYASQQLSTPSVAHHRTI